MVPCLPSPVLRKTRVPSPGCEAVTVFNRAEATLASGSWGKHLFILMYPKTSRRAGVCQGTAPRECFSFSSRGAWFWGYVLWKEGWRWSGVRTLAAGHAVLAHSPSYGFTVGGCNTSQGLVMCHRCSEGLQEPQEFISEFGLSSPSF